MFLLTQSNIEPLVATKDLKVIKVLRKGKYEDEGYTTPFQGFPVELGKALVPSKGDEESQGVVCGYCGCRTQIGGGYIHAYMNLTNLILLEDPGVIAVEAYIPKGTEYYIDLYLKEVCAKKLYITDRIIELDEEMVDSGNRPLGPEETLDLIKPLVDGIPTDKVSPGWLYIPGKRLVHPNSMPRPDDLGGVVAYTDANNNIITILGLSQYFCDWYDAEDLCRTSPKYPKCEYPDKDFCIGRWKLPSRETLQEAFSNNLMQMNSALLATSGNIDRCLLDNTSNYWTSAERSFDHSWFCNTDYAYLGANNDIWCDCHMRPSLDLVRIASLCCGSRIKS